MNDILTYLYISLLPVQQVGSELIYTNTLQTVHSDTMIRRLPSLILPLACHISAVKAKGQYRSIIVEDAIFGSPSFWLEFGSPRISAFQSESGNTKQQVEQLDMYVMSNCRTARVELIVDNCVWSVTENLSDPQPLQQG